MSQQLHKRWNAQELLPLQPLPAQLSRPATRLKCRLHQYWRQERPFVLFSHSDSVWFGWIKNSACKNKWSSHKSTLQKHTAENWITRASCQRDEVALNWDMLLSDGVRCLCLVSQCIRSGSKLGSEMATTWHRLIPAASDWSLKKSRLGSWLLCLNWLGAHVQSHDYSYRFIKELHEWLLVTHNICSLCKHARVKTSKLRTALATWTWSWTVCPRMVAHADCQSDKLAEATLLLAVDLRERALESSALSGLALRMIWMWFENFQKLSAQQRIQMDTIYIYIFQLCPRKPILSAMQQEPSWEGAQRPPGALARRRPVNKSALYQFFKKIETNSNMTWLHRNSSFNFNTCVTLNFLGVQKMNLT